MSRIPRIGISTWRSRDRNVGPTSVGSNAYAEAVWEAGGVPLFIPFTTDDERLHRLLKDIDGLLLTGGEDIHPQQYHEEFAGSGKPDVKRDEEETRLTTGALRLSVPILGICRGMQIVNVCQGGTLVQDIPGHRQPEHASTQSVAHDMRLSGTLAAIYGAETLEVNSYHHQAVKTLGEGLQAEAWAPDGTVEGMSDPKRYLVAVQWHPELQVSKHPEQIKLFRWLVEMAARPPAKRS